MAISAEQILDAENLYKSNPKYKDAKFIIEDGNIIMIGPNDPAYANAYQTPQDAAHFEAGDEPTRSVVGRLGGSALAPLTQHQMTDPVRAEKRDAVADAAQDVLGATRYALPFLGTVAPAPAAAILSAGAGFANKGISYARDEAEFGESVPNILLTAAATGAGAAANRYFSGDQTRKRHMKDKIAERLNIDPKDVDKRLMEQVKGPLKRPGSAPIFTVEDWQKQPLRDFDTAHEPSQTAVSIKRLPTVYAGKGAKVLPRKPGTAITDETLNRFMTDSDVKLNDPRREGIRKFIKTAWTEPQSSLGRDFYPTDATRIPITKDELVHRLHINPMTVDRDDARRFAAEMYRKNATIADPELHDEWRNALDEYGKRANNGVSGGKVISPKQYHDMGKINVDVPILGKKNIRKPLKYGSTFLLPIITEVGGKYILPKIVGDKNDER